MMSQTNLWKENLCATLIRCRQTKIKKQKAALHFTYFIPQCLSDIEQI